MEKYSIKSVTFGGFDKQDVIAYIEKTAREAQETEQRLQGENAALQQKLEEAACKEAALQQKLEELQAAYDRLQAELGRESAARQTLEVLKPLEEETARLKAENDALRPDAEAYAQFRNRIGVIECEARERAAVLEANTLAQLRRTVELFRAHYVELMSTFEATAAHVNSELRKVEVNLTQLPRAMDQAGSELNALAAVLEKKQSEQE